MASPITSSGRLIVDVRLRAGRLMNRQQARSLATAEIADCRYDDDIAVIMDELTIEKPWGWVFFYQSRRYLETGDYSSCLLGNAPIIVDARTGAIEHTGTAYPVEYYIADYERRQGL